MALSRRDVLKASVAVAVGSTALATAPSGASAREAPDHVTVSYDDALIQRYQPELVLDGVEPLPSAFHALHAESSRSSLNAVYGFTKYPYQSGVSQQDSHLGDHEPIIVWYDQSTGDVERIDYAAYHWFRGTAGPSAIQFADGKQRKPVMRVDQSYHHYYLYQGELPGSELERRNLLNSIETWRNEGLDEELAPSQPNDPWAMLSRESWWRHNAGNWLDATLKSLWFNLGLSDARETSDVEEVSTW